MVSKLLGMEESKKKRRIALQKVLDTMTEVLLFV